MGPLTKGKGYEVKILTRRISSCLRKENGRMFREETGRAPWGHL